MTAIGGQTISDSVRHRRFAPLVAVLYGCIAAGVWMPTASASAQSTTLAVDRNTIRATRGDRDVVIYRQSPDRLKAYVEQWYSPAGTPLLLDRPADHEHHHGLMLALGANDCEFWHEHLARLDPRSPRRAKLIGRQSPRGGGSAKVVQDPKGDRIVIEQSLDWLGGQQRILAEQRRIEIADSTEPIAARVLTWQSRLSIDPDGEAVDLWGAHYFGLGMRLRPADAQAEFTSADGAPHEKKQGSERLWRGAWCSYAAKRSGQELTLVLLDDPDNPRPATWFTMDSPFTYLSATLAVNEKPLRVGAGESVRVRYGIVVADRALTAREIGNLHAAWLEAKGDAQ